MNTKIDGLTSPVTRSTGSPAKAPAAPAPGKGGAAAGVDDSVKLSGDAVDIVALAKSMGGAPAFDAAKVQAVRTALETGTYRIDAQDIARRLVQLERQLGL
ncbi:flagellar biosynthesis anti-sigma factor FlgM [Pseudomarimonas salicorniae]|uniref:Negative regulator of flagellin synthesis n=1 Tax=Pseudomarimonas salicorniae TaxID=2933270 RepID=A0ABT0GKV5_9GAMM|nr:flagellar biosynthesis anti-sigma factor FlgM [Lysobacter sp. CAU 1642]MCK7595174.1 flagellar biosynthesis anti-sigma factor FlgM [Lysobacter sp. CAU 1642]